MRKIRFPSRLLRDPRTFLRLLRRELVFVLSLFLYVWSIFITLIPRPAIHLLIDGFLQMVILLVIWCQGTYLLNIWRRRPSDSAPTFPWKMFGVESLILLGPYALVALLLLLSGYRW